MTPEPRPLTAAGQRLLNDLTDLDTTRAAPTGDYLGPTGVLRAILAIEAEARALPSTPTPDEDLPGYREPFTGPIGSRGDPSLALPSTPTDRRLADCEDALATVEAAYDRVIAERDALADDEQAAHEAASTPTDPWPDLDGEALPTDREALLRANERADRAEADLSRLRTAGERIVTMFDGNSMIDPSSEFGEAVADLTAALRGQP